MLPTSLYATALAVLTLAGPAGAAGSGDAPFGLAWGPVANVPRPLMADREANLTALYYPQGMAPAIGPGTAGVILVVCRDEGLQQVIWVGLPLAGEAGERARRAIREEGVRRYGEPHPGAAPDSEVWPGGRATLAGREVGDGRRELVMTAFGPGYAACSDRHRAETGHPAGAHASDLVAPDLP